MGEKRDEERIGKRRSWGKGGERVRGGEMMEGEDCQWGEVAGESGRGDTGRRVVGGEGERETWSVNTSEQGVCVWRGGGGERGGGGAGGFQARARAH